MKQLNQELIKKVAAGELAVENEFYTGKTLPADKLELLTMILRAAFLKDNGCVTGHNKFYGKHLTREGFWNVRLTNWLPESLQISAFYIEEWVPKNGEEVEVSNYPFDEPGIIPAKEKFIGMDDQYFICSKQFGKYNYWLYCRPIQKQTTFTHQEALEALAQVKGVPVEQIKIEHQ